MPHNEDQRQVLVGRDTSAREAWRDGFDAAINMMEVAAQFAHGGRKTIGGNAILRTTRSIARVRDDAEEQAAKRGLFEEDR